MRELWNKSGPPGVDGSVRYNNFGKDWSSATDTQKLQRRAYGYRGRGDYYSENIKPLLQKYIPSGSFSKAGGFIGGMMGGGMGSTAGSALGGLASKYLGYGDYATAATTNQIMGGGSGVTVNASDDLTGDLYFSHKEFLQNVTVTGLANSSSAFQLLSYPINPGLNTTFPFLAQLAQNFVLYEMLGCIFEYKPTSGESGTTNNSLGKVIMATSYDPSAPSFVNSVQMENYDYATSSKPSNPQLHGVETKSSQQFGNMQYIRTGPSTRDLIFTDIGNFQIATEGVPLGTSTTVVLGELWVTYRVKLSRSNLFGSLLCLNSATDTFVGANVGGSVIGSNSNDGSILTSDFNYNSYALNYLQNKFLNKKSNNLGCSVTGVNATLFRITWPTNIVVGQYLVTIYCKLDSVQLANGTLALASFTNCAATPFQPAENANGQSAGMGFGSSEVQMILNRVISVTAPGNSIASVNCNVGTTVIPMGPFTGNVRIYVTVQCVNYNMTQL